MRKYNAKEDGFTLVELLIVVLIIGVLAAIAIPVYLGVQSQAHHSAVQADTNMTVKAVQVALTEGGTVSSQYTTKTGSDTGSTVQVKASTTTGAGANDFMVITTGSDGYWYQYDSTTGKFTDGTDVVLGGGSSVAPAITSAPPTATATVGTAYSYYVVATGTPAPTYAVTAGSLPAGLTLVAATGRITGNPTTAGTYTFTVSASNGVGTAATQAGSIVVSNAAPTLGALGNGAEVGETTNAYWQTGTGTAFSTAYAHSGSRAFEISTTAAQSATSKNYTPSGFVAGATYVLKFWYYIPTGSIAGTGATGNLYDTADGWATTTISGDTTQGVWKSVSVTFTAKSTTFMDFGVSGSSNGVRKLYIDDLSLIKQ